MRRQINMRKRSWNVIATGLAGLTLLYLFIPFRPDVDANRSGKCSVDAVCLTLFTAMKPMALNTTKCSTGHLQSLAFLNWLDFASEVIIFVDDKRTCSALKAISTKLRCIQHNCMNSDARPELRKPIMSCLFKLGEKHARTQFLMYTNPDVLYTDPRPSLLAASTAFSRTLLVGQRSDMYLTRICGKWKYVDLNQSHILEALGEGRLARMNNPYYIDYFIFSRGALPLEMMPAFLIGLWRWDTWLLSETIRLNRTAVIDAISTLRAAHLGFSGGMGDRPGSEYNEGLYANSVPGRTKLPLPYAGFGAIDRAPYATEHVDGAVVLRHRIEVETNNTNYAQQINEMLEL